MTVNKAGVDMFVSQENDDKDSKMIDNVITNSQPAVSYFTPQFVYVLNKCRRLTVNDPSSITSSKYWERNRTACS